ncbi:MAG: LysM peptidoglycan-binding domain-containing protein [Candidatus Omnitrophica bacterium]|nr:LysM peptidoglycan-binding domain-containing protein [Candidatus Omnitrophota bacterium]
MKKLLFLAGIIIMSGCLTMRTYTKEEPRKDLEIEGNQGCLSGECKKESKENRLGDTRTISVVEVEFDSPEIENEAVEAEAVGEETVAEKVLVEKAKVVEAVSEEDLVSAEKIETQYYTVQDNDTLQKISSEFYGTTRKWNFLYEANQDALKSPDRLYPGIEIKIPPLN